MPSTAGDTGDAAEIQTDQVSVHWGLTFEWGANK